MSGNADGEGPRNVISSIALPRRARFHSDEVMIEFA